MEKSHIEMECTAMENLFHQIISNMKISFPLWEDLTGKAVKLNSALRTTLTATTAFLEALQKVANLAVNSKGVGIEMGVALTKLCVRQRAVEDKLKSFTSAIMESLVNPLQDHMEEWKKTVVILDKDHAKESKKAHQDIKKASSETVRLKKKSKKGKPDIMKQLDNAMDECNEKYQSLEVMEKNAVKSALTEERNRFCSFVQCLKPVVDCEVGMLAEMAHVEQLIASLSSQAAQPFSFPSDSSEYLPQDVKSENSQIKISGGGGGGGSPGGSHGSRKSSVSSASSTSVHSPSRTSSSNAFLNSSKRSSECRDGTTTAGSPSKVPTMSVLAPVVRTTAPPQTQMPWTGWPDETLARTQIDEGPQGGLFREPACAIHQYAVPCSALDADSCESVHYIPDAYSKASLISEGENLKNSVSPQTVVPLEGYVNMNQLACYAVQHQEMNKKQEETLNNEPLPPPPPCLDLPPSGVAFSAVESGVYRVSTATDSIKRCTNSRARTTEDVPFTAQSLLRYHSGTSSTVRRVNLRDRSLPPISRKPSKSSTLPFRTDSFPTSPPPPEGRRSSVEGQLIDDDEGRKRRPSLERQLDYGQEIAKICSEFRLDALPPPPPPDMRQPICATYDDVDDLPLPPPPDNDDGCRSTGKTFDCRDWAPVGRRAHHGSMVSSHASIIESLNVKFFDRRSQPPPGSSTSSDGSRAFNLKGRQLVRRASEADCLEEAAAGSSSDSFTTTIEKGVKLRRAMTNDRSAPRF